MANLAAELLELSDYLNSSSTVLTIPHCKAQKWELLLEKGVIRLSADRRVYFLNIDKFVELFVKMFLDNKNVEVHKCDGRVYYADLHVADDTLHSGRRIVIRLFWAFTGNDTLVDCVTDFGDELIIPVIFMPRKLVESLMNEYRSGSGGVAARLVREVIRNSDILSLIVPLLPFPSDSKTARRYASVIMELYGIAYEAARGLDYRDEYDFIARATGRIAVKALVPFAYLYGYLRDYGLAELRSRGKAEDRSEKNRWDDPATWFEEIVKVVLANVYVRNRFDDSVWKYLIDEYRTGGPCKEDIAIPLKRGDDVSIVIVDTKLHEGDVCSSILAGTRSVLAEVEDAREKYVCGKGREGWPEEHLLKYEWYVKVKSEKLERLVQLVGGEDRVRDYYLVFVQRVRASSECVDRLNSLVRYYKGVKVYSVEELVGLLLGGKPIV